ncbi:hybrid sensor histidine kinase/response regulator transcription factor [Pedobacter sp. AW31-3R]|uniref:hybrid sensor histidine kinase/response regulator transcription factor n=1 Tax=Pedobacter sp. AW31-3R TaxID=3445781 RepID=UPI003FA1060E
MLTELIVSMKNIRNGHVGIRWITIFAGMACMFIQSNMAMAQPPAAFEHYSTLNGLSDNRILCMIKDREGFMWMGTWSGICRFDGHNFITYKSQAGDNSELRSNRIDQILEDQQGFFWVKAYDGHIYRFDKSTGKFSPVSMFFANKRDPLTWVEKMQLLQSGEIIATTKQSGIILISYPPALTSAASSPTPIARWFSVHADKDGQLNSDSISYFYQDRLNRLWIGTNRGVQCLKRQSNGMFRLSRWNVPVSKLSVSVIAEEDKDMLFATLDGKLLRMDKKTGKSSEIHLSAGRINDLKVSIDRKKLYCSTSKGELITVLRSTGKVSSINRVNTNHGGLFSIYEDRTGILWIEPEKKGIFRLRPGRGTFTYFSQQNYSNHVLEDNKFHVTEDHKGRVWINMKSFGFGYFDTVSQTLKPFHNQAGSADRLFSNLVKTQYIDAAGILWLSTDDGGLEKIVFQQHKFKPVILKPKTFFKAENEVRGLLADKEGRLWVATKSAALYITKNGKPVNNLFTEPLKLMYGVYSIFEDSKGNIWLGTKGNGLFKAEPIDSRREKYRIRHFLANAENPYALSSNFIYSLAEDKTGSIWVGTYGGGINLLKESSSGTVFYNHHNVFRHYPIHVGDKVRHLAVDKKGVLWIGTTDGLLVYDPQAKGMWKGKFIRYGKIPGRERSLGGNDIQFIYGDSGGQMWVLTSSGGLNKAIGFDPMTSLEFINYNKKNGLPSDYLLSCIEDQKGALWLATQNGFSRMDRAKGNFSNFDRSDGLSRLGLSEASCTLTQEGELIFGALDGYIRFDPKDIHSERIQANMAITNIRVNNENLQQDGSASTSAGNPPSDIVLTHTQNMISFDFAVLDYRWKDKESYSFILEGYDQIWQDNRDVRSVSYTNLPPGDYRFRVRSASTELYTNIPEKSVSISIRPPFWRTCWAYLLYAAVLILILWKIRQTALTMLHLKQRIIIERELTEMKLNFFTGISHELRTPLTLIVNPLEEIGSKETLSVQGQRYLELVRRNAQRMNIFVNQLLDLRKTQSGVASLRVTEIDIVALIQHTVSYFSDVLDQKKIKLLLEFSSKKLLCWADEEKLETVLYNVISNAIKFSPDHKSIHLTIQGNDASQKIAVEVTDEGPGVLHEELEDIFKLYFEGKRTSAVKGSGIGLALSKELILLHHGAISARNLPAAGLAVRIELKTGTAHFAAADLVSTAAPEVYGRGLSHSTMGTEIQGCAADQPDCSKQLPLILLVEDNADLQLFLREQLTGNYMVETADNGKAGLEKIIQLLPDLVLTDVMMPEMTGIEMLDRIKNNPAISHIPVILLSAKFSIESQLAGLKYGADHYIQKPFHKEYLMTTIDNLISQRKRLFEHLLKDRKMGQVNCSSIPVTTHDQQFLKEVLEIVEGKMTDPQFNIDTVVEMMHMSRSPFYKKLKSLTGFSPVEFVREVRLKRSLQYLDAGEQNISLIAYELGFNSAKYFSTCFRQRFQVSPTDYLKNAKLEPETLILQERTGS